MLPLCSFFPYLVIRTSGLIAAESRLIKWFLLFAKSNKNLKLFAQNGLSVQQFVSIVTTRSKLVPWIGNPLPLITNRQTGKQNKRFLYKEKTTTQLTFWITCGWRQSKYAEQLIAAAAKSLSVNSSCTTMQPIKSINFDCNLHAWLNLYKELLFWLILCWVFRYSAATGRKSLRMRCLMKSSEESIITQMTSSVLVMITYERKARSLIELDTLRPHVHKQNLINGGGRINETNDPCTWSFTSIQNFRV